MYFFEEGLVLVLFVLALVGAVAVIWKMHELEQNRKSTLGLMLTITSIVLSAMYVETGIEYRIISQQRDIRSIYDSIKVVREDQEAIKDDLKSIIESINKSENSPMEALQDTTIEQQTDMPDSTETSDQRP